MASTIRRPRSADIECEPLWEKVIAENFFGDVEMFRVTAEAFLENTAEYLGGIGGAISKGSVAELIFAAHKLKGALQNFGPSTALNVVSEIEVAARRGQMLRAQRFDGEFTNIFNAFVTQLSAAKEAFEQ